MPDSFPPQTWGPPFDERDLDALLSGPMADPPLALRQVADALAALRAAPAPAELTGEAAARAEFRALAGLRASRTGAAARNDGREHTLVLPAPPPARAGRRHARHRSGRGARPGLPARPHRARPPGRRLGRRGGVLVAAAGAALIVAVIALTGSLPGSIRSFGRLSADGKLSATPSAASSASQNVQAGSAAREPSHKATPSHSASVPPSASSSSPAQTTASTLCQDFYAYLAHPRLHVDPLAEITAYQNIARLAGDPVPFDVNSYCGPYVQGLFPHGLPRIPGFLSATLPGPQGGPGDGQPAAGRLATPVMMNGKPVTS